LVAAQVATNNVVAHGLSPILEGECDMPFSGIVGDEQLAMLTKVLDDYCAAHGIEPSSPERLDVGHLIMSLYQKGIHIANELEAALAVSVSAGQKPKRKSHGR
jgi:hypothetical protein